MPKIEKECHAFVLSGQMNREIKAKNQSNNQNQPNNHHHRPPHQNNYNHGHNNHHNNRNYSKNYNNNGGHNNSHRHDDNRNYKNYNNRPSNPSDKDKDKEREREREKDREKDKERNKINNQYSIIPNTSGNKETGLSSNLTSLFKSENTTNVMISQSLNVPKEAKNENIKPKEQNKQQSEGSHDVDKTKKQENGHKNTMQPEDAGHKRRTSHDIDSFEKISKKRQVDPIKQNS